VMANETPLGKTKVVENATSCVMNEEFYVKTKNLHGINFRFTLKDKDDVGDDDVVGDGYLDMGETEVSKNQKVHLKWKGKDIGSLTVSIDELKAMIVN